MTAALRAVCPGCKRVLRVPADWLHRTMRCKHCGAIVQARPKAPVLPDAEPAAPPGTPLPPMKPLPPGPDASPFANLDEGSPLRQPRRRSHGVRIGVLVLALIVALFAFVAIRFRPQFHGLWTAAVETRDSWAADVEQPPVEPMPPTRSVSFPRRALAISVNHYLYFNPVNGGPPLSNARNVHTLLRQLNTGLRIPSNQMAELSDQSPGGKVIAPLKPVIEQTVSDFLATSRGQDRVLLLFIGHAVELGEEAYLVPVEGELDRIETLIPLKWLYEQLAGCKARQKVLVLDVCRFNPARGLERPGSGDPDAEPKGAMGPRLDALLQQPPAGVQVWSACVAGQHSYEFDNNTINNGVFVEALFDVLGQNPEGPDPGPDHPLPIAALVDRVNARIQAVLAPYGKVQTSRLTGAEPETGAPSDPREPPPPPPAIAPLPIPPDGLASRTLIQGILNEIEVPPVKITRPEGILRAESLPPFSARTLAAYTADAAATPFRQAVNDARQLLNETIRGKERLIEEYFAAPANETRFKDQLNSRNKEVARVQGQLLEALDALKQAGKDRAQEPSKRWQANYDYVLARLQMQIAYLFEYQSALGAMRKELPARDPQVHKGWRLAAQRTLQGDRQGRDLEREARKLLEQLAKDHPGTPWEVLARRDRLTSLGLDWQPQ